MAGFSAEDIQRVREANDLVEVVGERVPVKQKGRDFWCCCPFHQEKTPSCIIHPDTQLWHCFGCHEGGDIFTFVMKLDDVEFPDAVRALADRAHIEIVEQGGRGLPRGQKARLSEICREAAAFYHTQLMKSRDAGPAQARAYLASRGFGSEVSKRWQLGFAPGRGALVAHLRSKGFSFEEMVQANVALAPREGQRGGYRDRFFNRVMFPINNAKGDCIAFGGRIMEGDGPKYLNSNETPLFHKSETLYGLDKAKAGMAATGTAIVCEGYTDVISLHEAGVTNAVATLGTALTTRHIRIISSHAQKRIVYLFDGDAAGQEAANRALQFIDYSMTPEAGKTRVELMAAVLPDNLDPADFVAQRGADALREEIDKAEPLLKFGIDRRLERYDLGTAEGRTRALADALSVLAPIKDSLIAKDYAIQIASAVRAREDDVLERLAQLQPPRTYEQADGRRAGAGAGVGAGAGERRSSGQPVQPRPAGQPVSAGQPGQAGPSPYTADASQAVPSPQVFTPDTAPTTRRLADLPEQERNRLRFERELLGLCAQDSTIALQHAQSIAQVNWHSDLYRQVAEALLALLERNPQATPVEMVSAATLAVPQAASILTGVRLAGVDPGAMADYLVDELAIGDQEEALQSLRAQQDQPGISPEEAELLYQASAALQADLNALRLRHKPL